MKKFIFSPDHHWGYEQKGSKLSPLHDKKAIMAMLKFASDFKPDHFILGGDNLDCGPVSHWLQKKTKAIVNLDILKDFKEYNENVIRPINALGGKRHFMVGNHEDWIAQFAEYNPGVSSILQPQNNLELGEWDIIDQGKWLKLGKLLFVHGDNIGNAKNMANRAVELYNHSVRIGHFHTFQVGSKYSLADAAETMTGIAVPGLCNKNPNYIQNRPNQWLKGFCYGYIMDDGTFHDYVPIYINGRFVIDGKVYRG